MASFGNGAEEWLLEFLRTHEVCVEDVSLQTFPNFNTFVNSGVVECRVRLTGHKRAGKNKDLIDAVEAAHNKSEEKKLIEKLLCALSIALEQLDEPVVVLRDGVAVKKVKTEHLSDEEGTMDVFSIEEP